MINGDNVEFEYQSPHGGPAIVSIPVDVYMVFVAQARSLEQLQILVFAWPTRMTGASRNNRTWREKKAKEAVA